MYAHSANSLGERQPLREHLLNVARLASDFGEPFGASDLLYVAGLLHDAGKLDPAWQAYLIESERIERETGKRPRSGSIDHKFAGVTLATAAGWDHAALLIHAHHGGLSSPQDFRNWASGQRGLPGSAEAARLAPAQFAEIGSLPRPSAPDLQPTGAEFYLRMAYSALVDADSLDTERHALGARASDRGSQAPIAQLRERLLAFEARSPQGDATSPVATVRREVRAAAESAAVSSRGLFRLTVPTGGGKTRSGMAFALRHAETHGLRRVIVVAPFTTITQQTAAVYRDIFEAGYPEAGRIVLEHHSAAGEAGGDHGEGPSPEERWRRLAAENWDAPVIVTTAVQFFESLFSNRRSATRKLHNIASSVVLIDEAQALPASLLAPILDGLHELTVRYGASVVLSTATQPAFDVVPVFREARLTEIVPGHAAHFDSLRRVGWEWRLADPASWDEVAAWVRSEHQVLVVVNTRRHAAELLEVLGDREAFHLSTSLCGAHRLDALREIRRRLVAGEPCRVVSTQVIEAGVDVDFPAVFRALAPLDSIIQAAGRCNREGRLAGLGRVVVFRTEDGAMPPGEYRNAASLTPLLARSTGFDPTDPRAVRRFSELLLEVADHDRKGIQQLRSAFNFPEVAARFRLIEEEAYDVVVDYPPAGRGRIEALCDRIRGRDPGVREVLRQLRPYTVSLRGREAQKHMGTYIEELMPGLGRWLGTYDNRLGLAAVDPDFIV